MKKKTLVRWLIAAAMVVAMVPLYAVAQTAAPPAEENYIDIPDPNFQKVLNAHIAEKTNDTSRPADSPITQEEMNLLTRLIVPETYSVTDITGIQYATNLEYLDFWGTVDGLDHLATLTSLKTLDIGGHNSIQDLTFLKSKPQLTSLEVNGCPNLTSLAGLTEENFPVLTRLELIDIPNIDISDIRYINTLRALEVEGTPTGMEQIAQLDNLTSLTLRYNETLTDLTLLGNKPHLTTLILLGCPNFMSLSGITHELVPNLERLHVLDCRSFYDLSALSNQAFPALKQLELYISPKVTDITPLKNYTSLTNLHLYHVSITEENREDYCSTVASLTSLTELSVKACYITEADAQVMLPPLSQLTYLDLSYNGLPSIDFLNRISADLTTLNLEGNNIIDMRPAIHFPNLEILNFGNNQVTDFSFVPYFQNLTTSGMGTASYPVMSRHIIAYVQAIDGTLTIQNPYVGVDGRPISFADAIIYSSAAYTNDYTISYNETTNEITLENVTGNMNFYTTYTVPLPDGQSGVFKLYFEVYTTEHRHTWGEPTYTWAEDGSSCTATRVCQDASTHVETVTAVISQEQTKAPTCTQAGETTYTATFAEDWAVTQILTLADVPQLPHSSNGAWQWDETNHFHICEVGGEHIDAAAHTFQWVTNSQTGERYQQCTVCGYQLAAEALPTPSATPQPNQPPQTGDTASVLPWASALVVGFALLPALMAWKRRAN